MITPSINELSQGKYNRYMLVIATAKSARIITDEYVKQRAIAEKRIAAKETDKSLVSMIKKEYRDEKAVKIAIDRIAKGDFAIHAEELTPEGGRVDGKMTDDVPEYAE
jgi:DNA-directed RNA polymerase subunit K/omega